MMDDIMTRPFNFRMPREVIFEAGCSALAASKAAALGAKRPVFVTGRSMAESAELVRLLDGAKAAGMEPLHWREVEPEPPAALLYRAAADIRDFGGDCLIAFGGGSSMDFAKMAAVLAKYPAIRAVSYTHLLYLILHQHRKLQYDLRLPRDREGADDASVIKKRHRGARIPYTELLRRLRVVKTHLLILYAGNGGRMKVPDPLLCGRADNDPVDIRDDDTAAHHRTEIFRNFLRIF